MNYSDLFHRELIEVDAKFASQSDMFDVVGDKLFEKGFVTNTFKEAITKREQLFPTGLAFEKGALAIPHTDVIHINKPFIYAIKLNESLKFVQMGTTDEWIEVQTIFMLGIKDPSKQVGLLSQIMEKVQDEQFTTNFGEASTNKEMETFLKKTFGSEE